VLWSSFALLLANLKVRGLSKSNGERYIKSAAKSNGYALLGHCNRQEFLCNMSERRLGAICLPVFIGCPDRLSGCQYSNKGGTIVILRASKIPETIPR
jgi:hypothetical protein